MNSPQLSDTTPGGGPASAKAVAATIRLISLATFFSGAGLRLCDGLLPRLATDFSITSGQAGAVVTSFSIAYGVAQLLFGPLGDRFGKALLICIALFGCVAGALASALAPDFGMLVWSRAAWGVAAAGVVPLSMAWVGDAVAFEERQATLARLLFGTLSGMMAGQLAGGLFADSPLGWRGAFAAMAAGFMLVGVLMVRRMRSTPASSAPGSRAGHVAQLRSVLAPPWCWAVLGAAFAEGVFLLGSLAFMPATLHERFGLSLSAAAGLIAFYAVGGLIYAAMARHLVARLGQARMVMIGGWIMGAGYLCWMLSPVAWTAAPVALAVGFGTYMLHNTLQTHATQMAPWARGTAVALFACSMFTGQALGALLTGWLHDQVGIRAALAAPVVMLPLTGWLFAQALRRRGAQDEKAVPVN